jgi:hypothetical protein
VFGGATPVTTQPNLVQSGFIGENEYDLRELWLIRNGDQTDLIFGRQFVPDLGAVKIDGLRVDYASSPKFTYLGFGGLYPLRGSRSLSTDYGDTYNGQTGADEGRIFTGAAGFGGAYRTQQAYGSVGAVALVPFSQEAARIFATSQGYWRINPVLDFYHFAIIDIASSYGSQLTNLSLGLNYKPTQRLRLTASFNRNDTDTLNIQAGQFFTNAGINAPNPANTTQLTPLTPGYVLNEIYIDRIATNEARGSISAALGPNQRFELTAAVAYRERPEFLLDPTAAMGMAAGPAVDIKAAESADFYVSFTDRHSFKDLRLGIDGLDSFPISGSAGYQRASVTSVRLFAARELESGKGEWEVEASYSAATDKGGTAACTSTPTATPDVCFGDSTNSVLSLGPTIYYRLNRDWFVLGSLYLQRTSIQYNGGTAAVSDAPIDGFTGFGRISYRF